jgi:hypothetical protein
MRSKRKGLPTLVTSEVLIVVTFPLSGRNTVNSQHDNARPETNQVQPAAGDSPALSQHFGSYTVQIHIVTEAVEQSSPKEAFEGQADWLKHYNRHQAKLAKAREKKSRQGVKPFGPVPMEQRQEVLTTEAEYQAMANEPVTPAAQYRKAKLPQFVVLNGFSEYVLACRHFATNKQWPQRKPPRRPNLLGLTYWQVKWIKAQKSLVALAKWRSELQKRRRNKQKAGSLLNEIANIDPNLPLPIALTPLARFTLNRKAKEVQFV